MASTLDRIAKDVGHLLKIVGAILGAPQGPQQLLATLGWDLPPGVNDIGLAAIDFRSVVQSVERLQQAFDTNAGDAVIAAQAAELLVEIDRAFTHVRAVIAALSAADDYLAQTQIKSELLVRMTDLFAASRIGAASPLGFLVLQLFGVVTMRTFAADPAKFQREHVRPVIDWDAFPKLFSDPVGLLQSRYGWGTSAFDGGSLVANLSALLEAIGEPVRTRPLPRRVEEQLAGRFIPEADTKPMQQLIASLSRGDASSGLDAGISFFPLRPTAAGASDGGLALNPFVHGFTNLQFPIAPETTLEFESSAALDSGVVLQFRPGAAPSLKAGLLSSGGVIDSATGKAVVRVKYGTPGTPKQLLELPGGGGVAFDSIAFAGGVEVIEGRLSPSFGVKITGGHAALRTKGADSFLASVLPGDGLDFRFDLGMRWSANRGFSFEGSAAAELDIPVHLSIAGLEVNQLHIGLRPTDAKLDLELSAGVKARLGPVTAGLDRVGALASLVFEDGNLGPVDLDIDFKPPSGVTLSVDARGIVSGGGFLHHDAARGLYAGAMQLSLQNQLTLSAYGLIATRMPDGSPGYSLIVFITAENFRPIPLGFGFNLLGIGGMVAINRTFDVEVLRQGLKNDTLGSLLFPRDPVGNGPALINALSSAFPARRGSYMFGLLAKIGWFTPTLVLLDLALILEFGARNRLLALGRISAMLPSRENDLVRLNLDAMGVIDFDAKTAAIDAVLVDSRLVHKFPITGAGALRAGLGSGPESTFVLAIGGLNPHFAAPSGFPSLERVTLALCSGNNPRLTCEAYFAITANTLQFGARASLYAGAGGFSIEGDIGYDVLVQWVPLHFIADYHARLQLKRGSSSLFMLEVVGELEGPRPLRLSGKATFKILFCHFSVRFDKTLVEGEPPPLPPAVDVKAELIKALKAQQAWSTQNPNSPAHGVALRSLPATAGAPLVLDPLGLITVKQQVVPLNTAVDIDTFGGAPVANERRFTLSASLSSDSTPLPQSALSAAFAPSQFFAISEEERLTGPSFETYEAGCTFGTEGTKIDERAEAIIAAPLEYATYLIDLSTPEQPPQSAPSYSPSVERLRTLANSGAAGRAITRRVGRTRFANAQSTPAATLKPKRWSIVPKGTGDAASVAPSLRTWSEYRATLNSLNRSRAHWQLVPKYEVES